MEHASGLSMEEKETCRAACKDFAEGVAMNGSAPDCGYLGPGRWCACWPIPTFLGCLTRQEYRVSSWSIPNPFLIGD